MVTVHGAISASVISAWYQRASSGGDEGYEVTDFGMYLINERRENEYRRSTLECQDEHAKSDKTNAQPLLG